MGNEEQVKVDTTSQAAATGTAEVTGALVAKTAEGARPTSYVTSKNPLEPVRPAKAYLSENSIHFVHIVIFVVILLALFYGMWTQGKKTKF